MNVDDVRELRLDGETHQVSQIWQRAPMAVRTHRPSARAAEDEPLVNSIVDEHNRTTDLVMGVLGIDVGGSGVKGAVVDTDTGKLVSERIRIATPKPPTPEKIAGVVHELVGRLEYSGPVGCSFPTVVVDGQALTAGNIDESWRGTRVDELFAEATGQEFVVHNDADVAGIAEMTLGAGRGLTGTVIMITIGTGLGSGVFYDGKLIPNIELGRMPGKDGEPIEFYAGDRARKVDDLSWDDWGERFNYFLQRVARVCAPAHFIIGGGASKKLHKFADKLDVDAPIRVAQFRNNAGIVGAAISASESGDPTSLRPRTH